MRQLIIAAMALAAIDAIGLAVLGPARAEEAQRTDAHGKKVKVHLTGEFEDCIRDGRKMGYPEEKVRSYCSNRPGLRR